MARIDVFGPNTMAVRRPEHPPSVTLARVELDLYLGGARGTQHVPLELNAREARKLAYALLLLSEEP